jgi:hypothetical protein
MYLLVYPGFLSHIARIKTAPLIMLIQIKLRATKTLGMYARAHIFPAGFIVREPSPINRVAVIDAFL